MKERENPWVSGRTRRGGNVYPPALAERYKRIPTEGLRDWLMDDANTDRFEDHLDFYLQHFEGRHFEWFIGRSTGDLFDIFHVLAAEALSVDVPSSAARWLIEPSKMRDELVKEAHSALAPGKETLWTCDQSILVGEKRSPDFGGPLFRLYYLLRQQGIGSVTSSKLLAARFPKVIPIRDSMISTLIQLKRGDDWWSIVRELLQADSNSLAIHLSRLKVPMEAEEISILRRLDIVLWMESHARDFRSVKAQQR